MFRQLARDRQFQQGGDLDYDLGHDFLFGFAHRSDDGRVSDGDGYIIARHHQVRVV